MRPLASATAILAALAPSILRAQQDSVRVVVQIQGISGELERNARAIMTLAREAEDGKLPSRRIPHLYQRGESEIVTALRPYGYYQPRIVKALEPGKNHWTAYYIVDPGAAVQVREVKIELQGEGADHPEFLRPKAEFPLQRGDTMRDLQYELGKLAFLTVASDSGYLQARFDSAVVLVTREDRTAEIDLRFDTGPRFRFGPIRFEQSILDDDLLRTRMTFEPGDSYRQDKLLALQNALSQDPYFSRVEVLPQQNQAQGLEVPIRVMLEPQPRWTYEFGAGYGTDTGPRARANGRWRWVNRQGHHADAEILVSLAEQRGTTRYNIPAVLHSTGLLTFFAGYSRTTLKPQKNLTPYGIASRTATAGVRLFRERIGWRETVSLAYQRTGFEIGVDTARTSLLIPSVVWERNRSDGGIPTRAGVRTRLELQGSNKALLSSASFFQIRAAAKAAWGFAPRFRVLPRIEVGRTFTSSFHELPPLIRFFTGGDESVRGYRYLSLGPIDSLGNVLGGRALMVGSLEVDYQVMPQWLVAAFTDVGNAMEEFTTSGLRQGIGAGVRYVSPIGLIRLDGAMAMNPRPGMGRFRLHITIGPDL